ncbi:MAG: hypothetical protein ACRDYV_06065, partial [Acidimicrobiia bacterium]
MATIASHPRRRRSRGLLAALSALLALVSPAGAGVASATQPGVARIVLSQASSSVPVGDLHV